MGKKDFRKTVRFEQDDLEWIEAYGKRLENRDRRGGGDGFSAAIRIAVRTLRAQTDKRTEEDAKALAAYYRVKNAGREALLDWIALGAAVADFPELGWVLRMALDTYRSALGARGTGGVRRRRSGK